MTTPLTTPLTDTLTLSLSTDPDPAPLISQLAVACANHPQAWELLDEFIRQFTLERGRLNLIETQLKMKKMFEGEEYGLH